jgi:hypothetical protein
LRFLKENQTAAPGGKGPFLLSVGFPGSRLYVSCNAQNAPATNLEKS